MLRFRMPGNGWRDGEDGRLRCFGVGVFLWFMVFVGGSLVFFYGFRPNPPIKETFRPSLASYTFNDL